MFPSARNMVILRFRQNGVIFIFSLIMLKQCFFSHHQKTGYLNTSFHCWKKGFCFDFNGIHQPEIIISGKMQKLKRRKSKGWLDARSFYRWNIRRVYFYWFPIDDGATWFGGPNFELRLKFHQSSLGNFSCLVVYASMSWIFLFKQMKLSTKWYSVPIFTLCIVPHAYKSTPLMICPLNLFLSSSVYFNTQFWYDNIIFS